MYNIQMVSHCMQHISHSVSSALLQNNDSQKSKRTHIHLLHFCTVPTYVHIYTGTDYVPRSVAIYGSNWNTASYIAVFYTFYTRHVFFLSVAESYHHTWDKRVIGMVAHVLGRWCDLNLLLHYLSDDKQMFACDRLFPVLILYILYAFSTAMSTSSRKVLCTSCNSSTYNQEAHSIYHIYPPNSSCPSNHSQQLIL